MTTLLPKDLFDLFNQIQKQLNIKAINNISKNVVIFLVTRNFNYIRQFKKIFARQFS